MCICDYAMPEHNLAIQVPYILFSSQLQTTLTFHRLSTYHMIRMYWHKLLSINTSFYRPPAPAIFSPQNFVLFPTIKLGFFPKKLDLKIKSGVSLTKFSKFLQIFLPNSWYHKIGKKEETFCQLSTYHMIRLYQLQLLSIKN